MNIRQASTYYLRHTQLFERPPSEVVHDIRIMRRKAGEHCVNLQNEIKWFIKYCLPSQPSQPSH